MIWCLCEEGKKKKIKPYRTNMGTEHEKLKTGQPLQNEL